MLEKMQEKRGLAMKMKRLRGRVVSLEGTVVTVLPSDGTDEVFIRLSDLPDAFPEMKCDLMIIPATNSGECARVYGHRSQKAAKPLKVAGDNALVKALLKSKERIDATIVQLERQEPVDEEALEKLEEKRAFLERGLRLFRS